MSAFGDSLLTVLSGGLPALLDGGETPKTTTQPTPRVEEVAPIGTVADMEPFLANVTQNQVLITTAGILGVLALIFVVRK